MYVRGYLQGSENGRVVTIALRYLQTFLYLNNTLLVYLQNVIQSSLSYATFQVNSEIWSHKTGGRLI
jgi:hypothetical protein